ncbi:MAG TPA: ABC transporter permease [Geminicoccus sp.]|uniref:ABC transporter permease n=1 Tax=Geminicoccus sp. TaxID=2024832 RepID=UPI002C68E55B|nr:ABC transporter permease [Geminicoccus sp.]HWL71629.1 ABC transporter permease [Geminicoccus sp.]
MTPAARRILLAVVIAIYALILAPIVVVVAVSFDGSGRYAFPPTQLSLHWFQEFFQSAPYFNSFMYVSLPIGLIVAVVATFLGMLVATALTRCRFLGRQTAEIYFTAPLFVPDILLAAALYLAYSTIGMKGSLLSIAAGHLVIALPYVVRTLMAGMAGIDPRLEEAAQNLGASPLRAFAHATFPLLQSSIVSGAAFAFIVSFSDINLSLFLSGPGTTTLPVHIFSQLEFQDDPTIAAASTLQILLVGGMLFVLQRLFQRTPAR